VCESDGDGRAQRVLDLGDGVRVSHEGEQIFLRCAALDRNDMGDVSGAFPLGAEFTSYFEADGMDFDVAPAGFAVDIVAI